MRLIDADKIAYMWQQDKNGVFHDGVTLESIINNMPTVGINDLLVKELEKIKQEVKTNRDEWIKGQDAEWHTYDRCLSIIDNHIEELRGE